MQMVQNEKDFQILSDTLEDFKKQFLSHSRIASKWMNINDLCDYHPDKPTRNTVYAWVSKGKIPFHKQKGAKRLRFLREEVDQWLQYGLDDSNSSDPTELLSGSESIKPKNRV